MPQKKPNAIEKLLPVFSTVMSFKSGGFAKNPKDLKETLAPQQGAPNQIQTSPMDRRMDTIKSDPLNVLGEAKQSLAYMPADVREQYQKPIDDAYQMALEKQRQQRQMGVA